MSLRKKVVDAFGWELASVIFSKGLSAIFTLVLSNYISAEQFGQVATVFIFYNILTTITGLGFEEALTRLKTINNDDKSTALVALLLTSTCFYTLLYLAAPFIAVFFNDGELVKLIQICCVIVVIEAITTVPKTELVRSLNFKPFLASSVISGILSFSIAFFFIHSGYGVWALIIQIICASVIKLFFISIASKWKPNLRFKKASFLKLFSFSKYIIAAKTSNSIFENSHFFTISKFISLEAAGYYFFSNRIKRLIFNLPINTVQKVTFPALAQNNDDPTILKKRYRKIIQTTSIVVFPLVFFTILFSDIIFTYLLKEQWKESQKILTLMCFSATLLPLNAININILHVTGRSDINFYLSIFRKLLVVTSLAIAYNYGLYAMLYSNIIINIIAYIPNSFFSKKLINYTRREQAYDFTPALFLYLGIYVFCKFIPATFIETGGSFSIYSIISFILLSATMTYLLPIPGKPEIKLTLLGYIRN